MEVSAEACKVQIGIASPLEEAVKIHELQTASYI